MRIENNNCCHSAIALCRWGRLNIALKPDFIPHRLASFISFLRFSQKSPKSSAATVAATKHSICDDTDRSDGNVFRLQLSTLSSRVLAESADGGSFRRS